MICHRCECCSFTSSSCAPFFACQCHFRCDDDYDADDGDPNDDHVDDDFDDYDDDGDCCG